MLLIYVFGKFLFLCSVIYIYTDFSIIIRFNAYVKPLIAISWFKERLNQHIYLHCDFA